MRNRDVLDWNLIPLIPRKRESSVSLPDRCGNFCGSRFRGQRAVLRCRTNDLDGNNGGGNAGGHGDRKAIDAVIAALAARFGNRLVTSRAVREQHANTVTWIDNQPPDAVVFPQTTEDVQEIVRLCAAERVPVIAFGAGTSLEGQVNAPRGGISLDFRDMNRVLAVHAEDLDCVVEPGDHAQAAQRASARSGRVFSDRSRRRRLARRHGGDALLRHQRRALRHHEGQCRSP